MKSQGNWVLKVTMISCFIDFSLVLPQKLEAGSANVSTSAQVYPWFIVNRHHVTDRRKLARLIKQYRDIFSNISDGTAFPIPLLNKNSQHLHCFLVLAYYFKFWLQSILPSIQFWPLLDTKLVIKFNKYNHNIANELFLFPQLTFQSQGDSKSCTQHEN